MSSAFELVSTTTALAAAVESIVQGGRFALDTESASFHRYTDRVYLVQLATEKTVWVVDPLAVEKLDAIGELLADPALEVVIHDADFDLRTLNRDHGFVATNVFDTRIAAEFAGEESVGLAALLQKYFDVQLDKRFQRADWSLRPLANDMLTYAANDTRYLGELRDLLAGRLREVGRLPWAEEEFRQIEDVRWEPPDPSSAYLRLKGAKALRPRQRAALRELHRWRDEVARRQDRSPFRVASNEALVATARTLPRGIADLGETPGVSPGLARRRGKDLLAAVRRALDLDESDLPQRERRPRRPPDPSSTTRFDRLRTLRAERSEKIGLAPGVICPNATLMALARASTAAALDDYATLGLKQWQLGVLGEDALRRALRLGEGDES